MTLHQFLDVEYGHDGDERLKSMLQNGADAGERAGEFAETALHVATRRRRLSAVKILVDHGADLDATTVGNKTAYAHAARRGFTEVTALLESRGADTSLNDADRLAVAVGNGRLGEARNLIARNPGVVHTGNPEEDRLLADMSGRNDSRPVTLLVEAGADLRAPGLDDGTPLHQAAWFGQPENARILIAAGAPLDVFERVHHSSPIGWVTHGSRFSGGADERSDAYVDVARLLLDAGCSLHYPGDAAGDAYMTRLMNDASTAVRLELERAS